MDAVLGVQAAWRLGLTALELVHVLLVPDLAKIAESPAGSPSIVSHLIVSAAVWSGVVALVWLPVQWVLSTTPTEDERRQRLKEQVDAPVDMVRKMLAVLTCKRKKRKAPAADASGAGGASTGRRRGGGLPPALRQVDHFLANSGGAALTVLLVAASLLSVVCSLGVAATAFADFMAHDSWSATAKLVVTVVAWVATAVPALAVTWTDLLLSPDTARAMLESSAVMAFYSLAWFAALQAASLVAHSTGWLVATVLGWPAFPPLALVASVVDWISPFVWAALSAGTMCSVVSWVTWCAGNRQVQINWPPKRR